MAGSEFVELDLDGPLLDRAFRIAPLVLVATMDADGRPDVAPKHMTMPVGERHVAFTCTPAHATLGNAIETGAFTVSWLRPQDVLLASLAAAPRFRDGTKPSLAAVPTRPATVVDGVVVDRASIAVECRLERIVEGFGRWQVVVGSIVHAAIARDTLLGTDEDPQDVLARAPVLAYLHPDHVATISRADRFPYHEGFRR